MSQPGVLLGNDLARGSGRFLLTTLLAVALLALGWILGAGTAQAVLLDLQTLRVTHEAPSLGTNLQGPDLVVVGPGVEEPSVLGIYSVDFSDTNILVKFLLLAPATFSGGAFNGLHVFDVNALIPAFTSVTINPATNLPGFNASLITFDADNIYVNFQGMAVFNETVSLDISGPATASSPAVAPVLSAQMLVALAVALAVSGVRGISLRRQRR